MIGYTPQQINDMSLWQFLAAIEGYAKAHSPDDGALSEREKDELWEWLQG